MHASYYKKYLYLHRMQGLHFIHPVSIDIDRINPDRSEILKLLGNQENIIDGHTGELVEKYIKESLQASSPKGAFIITEAIDKMLAGEINIQGTSFQTGSIIQKMLRNAEYYVFFLATAGSGPEFLARSLMSQNNYLEGYTVDLAASALVDQVADQIQQQVKAVAEEHGMRITNRYSPGYCSWKVEEQQKLFSLFPERCCNISLSASSLMDPIKSISGIIGVGAGVKYRDYSCEICSMPGCQFRRARAQ